MPVFGILTAAVRSCVSVSCDAQKKGGQGSKLHSANSRQARFSAHVHTRTTGYGAWPRLSLSLTVYSYVGMWGRKDKKEKRGERRKGRGGTGGGGLPFLGIGIPPGNCCGLNMTCIILLYSYTACMYTI